jgi:trans-2-enoyl-CoA reductase
MSSQNLDQLCAQFGYRIAEQTKQAFGKASDSENHITKSLGVLQEDGVYAFFLYQKSRKKDGANKCIEQAHELLKQARIRPFDSQTDSLLAVRGDKAKNLEGLAEHLDELLLAKRLLEQALIYARYHAKALE